jgi:hypothetical protein
MEFMLAFRYVVDRSGGWTNILLITVCNFIPVVGPIVLMGYRAEVAVALDRDPRLLRHPQFDFGRFVEYLTRGVWPFLVSLIVALVEAPVFLGVFFAVGVAAPNVPPALAIAAGLLAFALIVAISFFSAPMIFHSELTGKLDLGGAFRFAADFLKRVGGQLFLAGLAYGFISIPVIVIGLLCCCIGVYPASSLVQMAWPHIMVQLYQLYLDRGGDPLEEMLPNYDEDERGRRDHRHSRDDDYDD